MAVPIAKNLGLTVITNGSAANAERVLRLGADRFIDYKTEDYSRVLSDMDMVLDTLGDKELPKEFGILKNGRHLVSLRAMPNKAFAIRSGMSLMKRLLFAAAGRKVDQMAARKNQTYDFIFVHEDGAGLERLSALFREKHIETSVDEVFPLADTAKALQKVASGKSRGKTILRI
ncbi:MAG: zinc-binding dehydrogenase [Clostridia bacterium]|nr:zinc-binding dehydrogenase [Clostridia bacterium]